MRKNTPYVPSNKKNRSTIKFLDQDLYQKILDRMDQRKQKLKQITFDALVQNITQKIMREGTGTIISGDNNLEGQYDAKDDHYNYSDETMQNQRNPSHQLRPMNIEDQIEMSAASPPQYFYKK